MRTSFMKRALPFLFSALTLACREDSQVDPDLSTTQPPRSLEDALLYVSSEPRGGHAMTLDVATNDVKVVKHALPAGPVQTFALPGSDGRQVVVFTGGLAAYKEGDKRYPAVPAHVLVYSRDGELVRQPLSGRYSSLTISDDGKYAIAYGSSGNLVLQNAIEVISLTKASAKDPTAATVMDLSFDGRAPQSFVFSPSTGFANRRLAVAPLANGLQVIDLDHPENGETSIKLSDNSSLQPVKIVFASDQFFVQSQGSAQILSFQNIEQPRDNQPLHPAFQLAPSVLTANGSVTDLEVVGSGDTLRLLALAGDLEVLDPRIGGTAEVNGVSTFSLIHKFSGTSPVDKSVLPRAALYGPGRSQIGFVDLGNEKAWSTRNVELVELGDPLVQLIPIANTTPQLALATHTTNRVSLIDLEQRTVKRVLLDSSAVTTLLDQSPAALRLWVGGSNGSLGSINLQTLMAQEVPLSFSFAGGQIVGEDAPDAANSLATALPTQQNLLVVPGPINTPRRRIAVVQEASSGRLTLLDADNPSPETALEVVGFFLAGFFD
ncbi:MAG: hypothetical protein JWN48_4551 [Myxococcaceae bacterium]|nr:hypothetical protein [Myxococcaceae bacterium]